MAVHEDLDDEALEALAKGERMLWVAMAGAVISLPAFLANKPIIAMPCWIAAFFGAMGGIREVARATNGSGILALLAIFASFTPFVNLLPIGAYLARARSARKAALNPPQPEPPPVRRTPPRVARTASTAQPASTARPAPGMDTASAHEWSPDRARHELASAIAIVKQAGIGRPEGEGEIPDGTRLGLKARLPDGSMLPEEAQPVVRATHGTFAVFYLLDRGNDYLYVTSGHLAKAGLTLDELHAIGVRNLMHEANGTPGLKVLPQEGFYGLVMGGQFEASQVLVDPLWDEHLREYIPNGAVVGIPARDMCVFCDARSREGIAKVHGVVKRVFASGDHLLSDKLFLRRDGRWRPLGSG